MNPLKHSIGPRGNMWAVIKWKYLPNGISGTSVAKYLKKSDAKAECKRLNDLEETLEK